MMRNLLLVLAMWSVSALSAFAQETPFISGRPGNTESAIAVAQGRWQVETELASYAHDKSDGVKTDAWSAAATALRYGVARNWDVEAIWTPYTHVRSEENGAAETIDGIGDLTLRARHTFMGQDGEGASFGMIGYVTLPTADEGLGAEEVEGGLIAAGDVPLSDRWSATWTAGLAAISVDDDDHAAQIFGGVALGYSVSERWGVYVEGFADHADGDDEANILAQFGATVLISDETQLDFGFEAGLQGQTDDARLFIGWAHRI